MNLTRLTVAYILLIAIGVTSMVLLAYEVIRGEPISAFVLSLLSIITGFIGSSIAGAQGALQALSIPPGHVITPAQPAQTTQPSPTNTTPTESK